MSVHGVDLSSNNGPDVDFRKIHAHGYRFAIIKVTEGVNYVNPYVERQVSRARDAGLIVGGYAFLRPSPQHTAAEEADYFVGHLRKAGLLEKGSLRPTVDIEVTGLPKGLPSRRYDYRVIERIIARLDLKPFVYTGSWFWDGILGARNGHRCPLWLAAYTPAWRKLIPAGFRGVSIHQYTDKGAVPGVRGPVDLDLYLGRDTKMLHAHHCLGRAR